MQKIIPHLWFDTQARQAAEFYTSLFSDGQINWVYTITDTPSGNAELIEFQLGNMTLAAISAGPYFKLNESISFMVTVSTKEEIDRLYHSLSEEGRILMPLGEYDFNSYYVWVEDRFGLSWQLALSLDQKSPYHLDISLLFSQEQVGLAEPFLEKYQSGLKDASIGFVSYYPQGSVPSAKAHLNYGELLIADQKIIVMDHGYGGESSFNEAFSLMIYVDTQEEADELYHLLSRVPDAEQCGWVKDEFGVSWQIVPRSLMTAYEGTKPETLKILNDAILEMKRIDVNRINNILSNNS